MVHAQFAQVLKEGQGPTDREPMYGRSKNAATPSVDPTFDQELS
jgi:hypothetical protein